MTTKVRKILLLAGVILSGLLPAAAAAQSASTGRIYGRASEVGSGLPVETVNVYLKNTKLGAVTDRDGAFSIKLVPPGSLCAGK